MKVKGDQAYSTDRASFTCIASTNTRPSYALLCAHCCSLSQKVVDASHMWHIIQHLLHNTKPTALKLFYRTHLAAESAKDRLEWMSAITAASGKAQSGDVANPHSGNPNLTSVDQVHISQQPSATAAANHAPTRHLLSPGLTARRGLMQSLNSGPPMAVSEVVSEVSQLPHGFPLSCSQEDV